MKIKLPDFVLASLYKESLVVVDDVKTFNKADEESIDKVDEEHAEPNFFLGHNKKQIAMVVNDLQHRFTHDESLQLLINMLSALQMNLDDVAIINIANTGITYKEMQATLQTRICILFDVPTQSIGLPFQMPGYKVQEFNGCKFLCSASLQNMKGNGKEAKLEKTKLWMCLKTLFE